MGKRWTEEEKAFLIENYKTMSYQEIGIVLKKAVNKIESKKTALGLPTKKKLSKLSKDELKYIQDNYPRLSRKTIALDLNLKVYKVQEGIRYLKINAKKIFFKHDYLSILSISKILNLPEIFISSLVKCKFIRISKLQSQVRKTLHLIHIDEFERIKDFLNNYISMIDFAKNTFFSTSTISRKIKTGKIKSFVKVGSKYYIHKSELELQRSL